MTEHDDQNPTPEWPPPPQPYWHTAANPYPPAGSYGYYAPAAPGPEGQPPAFGPYGPTPYWAQQPVPGKRSRRPFIVSGIAAAVIAGGVAVAIAATSGSSLVSGTGTSAQGQSGTSSNPSTGSGSLGGNGYGFGGRGGNGIGGNGTGGGTGGTNDSQGTGLASASTAQQVGVVDIDTVLKYQSAKAAGTGMVITSNGEILTNNHVVDGATSITVTVVSTGKTYPATVVGTDPTDDVALIKINASGLTTIKTASAAVTVGAQVTGVGNAGGVGGTPSAASGTVTATDQTITASDESGANSETLTGLIQTDAPIQAGDSGGPLFNASNQVVGMDTAASSGGNQTTSASSQGYAIPINRALTIVAQMAAGKSSSTIHLGYPAFLGISLSSDTQGATVAGVVSGLPADQAGLVAGDVITAIDGTSIATASDLQTAIGTHQPGDKVSLTWTDTSGASHKATVTLVQGPAD